MWLWLAACAHRADRAAIEHKRYSARSPDRGPPHGLGTEPGRPESGLDLTAAPSVFPRKSVFPRRPLAPVEV